MKRVAFIFPAAILLPLLWSPQTASAKAPTVKITISGSGLKRSIEITDPQILEISSAWGDSFLDVSRRPLDEAPQGRSSYEVSFYSEIAKNDVRKTCVMYYYPSSSTERGLVYLPGGGVVWELNAGTVLRHGRDGKWSHASPAWDGLLKPIITRAAAAAAQPQLPEKAERIRDFSKASRIAADGWTKPQRGWLYVLDPQPESDSSGSRVWLFDPETAKVMGSIRAGYQPDIALSPDGGRLYVASGERETGELAVIDTGNGAVRHIPFPDRVLYTPWYSSLPPFSSMMLSSDGRALWILGHRAFASDKTESQVLTFDTLRERFLPTTLTLGNCGGSGKFVPSSTANQFEVLCPRTDSLHLVRLNADYRETAKTVIEFPGSPHCPAATGFLLAGGRSLALIGHDGAIHEMDMSTQELRATRVTGQCVPPWIVSSLQWPRSPDGAKVYIGYGPPTPDNLATSNTFRVFNTVTWQELGGLPTSVPFWSAIANEDGTLIYAFAPKQHSILVIDAITLQEKRRLSVGKLPALGLASP